jgi:hypothetical protein
MADPVTLALGAQAIGTVAGGAAALGKAKGERALARSNAYIADTRAIQTGTANTEQLASDLATLRATIASNGQGMDGGTAPFFQELRRIRARENRIAMANERQAGADYRQAGRNSMAQGYGEFGASLFRAASLFDYSKMGGS